jgi:hypothetical protein
VRCPRIAQQIALAFDIPINKDVVRRILAAGYRPAPDSAGLSWLTVLGHAKDVTRHLGFRPLRLSAQSAPVQLENPSVAVIIRDAPEG